MKTEYPKNILIIKPSALGDIVLALPALTSLRFSFPDSKISWLIRPEFASILDNTNNVDEKIIFDRKLLGKCWYNATAFKALVNFFTELRRHKFDLVIDLQGLFRTAFFAWITGCKRRFGMTTAREFASLFYTNKILMDDGSIHVIDYYKKIISETGADEITDHYQLSPSEVSLDYVTKLLRERNVRQNSFAVLVPGSAHRMKCWPPEKFAAVADKLNSAYDLDIIAVGTYKEKSIVEEIKSIANIEVHDFVGKTNISQLIALMSKAGIVISNDTGPGHIAAALNIPLVMIFGPTNPARIHPYNKPNSFAAIEPFSRGRTIENLKPDYRIEAVTIDMVFEKVSLQLK